MLSFPKELLAWTFMIPKDEVLEACEKKVIYHSARLERWTGVLTTAEKEVRESVDFRDREYTGGRDIEVVFDPEKSKQLKTAKEKVAFHTDALRKYQLVARALKSTELNSCIIGLESMEFFGL